MPSGTGGMGTGSDTRIYNPRSESSHMYVNNNEEDRHGAQDGKDKDDKMDKKREKDRARKRLMSKIKHIKVRASDLEGFRDEEEEGEDDADKRDQEREISAQTGPPGNLGFLTSLANQAKGPGAAGGEMFAMGEPMEEAWSDILKVAPRRSGGGKSSRAPPRTMRFGKVRQQRPAPKPRNISAPTEQQQAKPVPFNPNDLPVAPEEPVIGDPTMPYGKPMIPGDARMDMNPNMPPQQPNRKEVSDEQRERLMSQIRDMEQNIHPTMDRPGSIDIPPEERDKYLTMQSNRVQTGEPMKIAFQILKEEAQGFVPDKDPEPKKDKGDKAKEKKEKKERSKKFRPSTGQFKMPPGGVNPASATSRRAKARSRGIKSGQKTGLGRAHLAVEMSHRGVQTKQPTSKNPQKYRQYMGQQEGRKRMGGVRTIASTPARFGTRSYAAGATGGGRLQGVQRPRRPALKPHRIPPIMPPAMPPRPSMPTPPPMPGAPPMPMPTAGVGVQQMAAPPMMRPGRLPSSSVQGVMTGPIGEGSEIQKKLTRYDIIELRQLVADAKRAIRQKESKKKGMGTKDTAGAGSNLPKHPENGPKQTTRPEGATEDANNEPRTFGMDPIGHYTSRGGRTP